MLTHRNMISCAAGALIAIDVRSTDTYIAALPLAHVFELGKR